MIQALRRLNNLGQDRGCAEYDEDMLRENKRLELCYWQDRYVTQVGILPVVVYA